MVSSNALPKGIAVSTDTQSTNSEEAVKRITFVAVAVLLAVGVSQAAVEVNLNSTSPGGGGSTLFTYDIDIGTNTTWRTNDFLVLYDFGPVMQAFSVLPAMLAFGAVQNT